MSRLSHRLRSAFAAPALLFMVACNNLSTQPESMTAVDTYTGEEHSTMLLVGLDDGTYVRQTLLLDADICIKELNKPTTICLKQGEAIVDNSGAVLGYEMLPETIELKSRH